MIDQEEDAISMRLHLKELQTAFDNAMNNGEVFENLKKIYVEMKELECRLKVVDCRPDQTTGK